MMTLKHYRSDCRTHQLASLCVFLPSFFVDVCVLGQLMQLEEKGKGSVPWSVYGVYIQAAGGPVAFLVIMALFILNVGSTAFSNWWLSYWIKQGSGVRAIVSFILQWIDRG